jgi:hypothetical protein
MRSCKRAGRVDVIRAYLPFWRPAIKNDSSAILRFFEIALVLVRVDHVARFIVNADLGVISLTPSDP